MATKTITIELDDEMYETTALLAEAAAETSLDVYIIEAVGYVNRMRMALPETKPRIQRWLESKSQIVFRVVERCNLQVDQERRRQGIKD